MERWQDLTKHPAPIWANYRAQDADGSVYDYRIEPFIASDKSKRWVKNGNNGYHFILVGKFETNECWRETLCKLN